ncbi:mannosyl-glycoprotein endo-beta-N-acetylglucosamidase [Paenibacillus albiflavus]|uniref:Mannosyl-glycoprotein endo-beta-N-acetylglucosamidase n=1 Tax=Paenibacillus albiflavus TaxID=2545760 RepID=A0A4R4E6L5_9BACL|nr:glycoside hydrolase family 73 protein [Paenibacillus albiflavus]TCZ75336.1 mannosyl-glycoprotein endo-beta-N-acetylglucosamidase [Paenibacillus albiflavus]
MNQSNFISLIAQAAVNDMKKTKVPASLTIAQAALESGWGDSSLTRLANNLFGIKGNGPAGSRTFPTKEFINGQWITVDAAFRVYNAWSESIADHSALVLNGTRDKPTRYHGVLGADYKTACQEIWKGGYATDPKYPQKLIDLIETHQLYKFDKIEEERKVDPKDANKIISFLSAGYNATDNAEARKEFNRLANELRKVSGQPTQ